MAGPEEAQPEQPEQPAQPEAAHGLIPEAEGVSDDIRDEDQTALERKEAALKELRPTAYQAYKAAMEAAEDAYAQAKRALNDATVKLPLGDDLDDNDASPTNRKAYVAACSDFEVAEKAYVKAEDAAHTALYRACHAKDAAEAASAYTEWLNAFNKCRQNDGLATMTPDSFLGDQKLKKPADNRVLRSQEARRNAWQEEADKMNEDYRQLFAQIETKKSKAQREVAETDEILKNHDSEVKQAKEAVQQAEQAVESAKAANPGEELGAANKDLEAAQAKLAELQQAEKEGSPIGLARGQHAKAKAQLSNLTTALESAEASRLQAFQRINGGFRDGEKAINKRRSGLFAVTRAHKRRQQDTLLHSLDALQQGRDGKKPLKPLGTLEAEHASAKADKNKAVKAYRTFLQAHPLLSSRDAKQRQSPEYKQLKEQSEPLRQKAEEASRCWKASSSALAVRRAEISGCAAKLGMNIQALDDVHKDWRGAFRAIEGSIQEVTSDPRAEHHLSSASRLVGAPGDAHAASLEGDGQPVPAASVEGGQSPAPAASVEGGQSPAAAVTGAPGDAPAAVMGQGWVGQAVQGAPHLAAAKAVADEAAKTSESPSSTL